MPAQVTAPRVRAGIGIIEQPAPYPVTVFVLLPIPARPERRIRIGAAVAGDARSSAALEGKRLADFHAVAAAEAESARVGGGGERISPEQKPLRARPDAMDDAPAAIFAQQVAV